MNITSYFQLLLILFLFTDIKGQWVQTSGPEGAFSVRGFTHTPNGYIFSSVAGDLWWPNTSGVYYSTNNGDEWIHSRNGLTGFYFGDIVFVQDGLGVSYLFLGEETGNGIFRSTDFGASWVPRNNGLTSKQVYAVDVDSTDVNNIKILVGTHAGLFITTDFGENWNQINNGITHLTISDVAIHPNGDYFATSFGNQVYHSTNQGQSWNSISNGLQSQNREILIGHNDYLYVGTDGNGVFRSINYGGNWHPVNNGLMYLSIHALSASPDGDIFVGTSIFEIGVGKAYKSTNFGESWISISDSLNSPRVFSFLFKPDGSGGTEIFAGTFRRGIYLSNNNGGSWIDKNTGLISTNIYSLIADQNGKVFAGTLLAGVFDSPDGGTDWRYINNGFPLYTYITVHDFEIKKIPPDNYYLFAATNIGIYRSTDKGVSFHFSSNGIPGGTRAVAVSPNGNLFAASYSNRVFISTNNGDSWEPTGAGITHLHVWALFVNQNGDVFAGTNGHGIFRSTNNGLSWDEINTGLTGTYIRVITSSPEGNLYAGTLGLTGTGEGGVFRSTNNGDDWVIMNSGLPSNSTIHDFAFYDNKIFVATTVFSGTSSNGVYISTNNGQSWEPFKTGLTNILVRSLTIDSTDQNNPVLYAGTESGGVWKHPIDPSFIPVELISFTSYANGNNITLNWITSSELNNTGFEVQKKVNSQQPALPSGRFSVSNSEFKSVGFVGGNGTTTETIYYSFEDKNLSAGKYFYRLKQIDFDGTFEYSDIIEVEVNIPTEFSLSQNYPNPFNPTTNIDYSIPVDGFVSLTIYNSIGQEVSTLVSEQQTAGKYSITFSGEKLPSGLYFYSLRSGDFSETRKMLFLK
jgi:photosystem II stability/assembly factor-like uncharacterized protein